MSKTTQIDELRAAAHKAVTSTKAENWTEAVGQQVDNVVRLVREERKKIVFAIISDAQTFGSDVAIDQAIALYDKMTEPKS